jgi:hypothetical protein
MGCSRVMEARGQGGVSMVRGSVLVNGDASAHGNSGASEVKEEAAGLAAASCGVCCGKLLRGGGHQDLKRKPVNHVLRISIFNHCTQVSVGKDR